MYKRRLCKQRFLISFFAQRVCTYFWKQKYCDPDYGLYAKCLADRKCMSRALTKSSVNFRCQAFIPPDSNDHFFPEHQACWEAASCWSVLSDDWRLICDDSVRREWVPAGEKNHRLLCLRQKHSTEANIVPYFFRTTDETTVRSLTDHSATQHSNLSSMDSFATGRYRMSLHVLTDRNQVHHVIDLNHSSLVLLSPLDFLKLDRLTSQKQNS